MVEECVVNVVEVSSETFDDLVEVACDQSQTEDCGDTCEDEKCTCGNDCNCDGNCDCEKKETPLETLSDGQFVLPFCDSKELETSEVDKSLETIEVVEEKDNEQVPGQMSFEDVKQQEQKNDELSDKLVMELKTTLIAKKEDIAQQRLALNGLYAENEISAKEYKEKKEMLGKEEEEINLQLRKLKNN